MLVLDRVRNTEFLGQEFLLWLWYRSETQEGIFPLEDGGRAELWFDGRMTLESEGGGVRESITCSGNQPEMREARFALTAGKQITQAGLKLTAGENEWSFQMDSTWMNFKSLKTPPVMQDRKEDPEGLFYEKVYLLEQPVAVMDVLFRRFIELRLSPQWESEELPALNRWVAEGR